MKNDSTYTDRSPRGRGVALCAQRRRVPERKRRDGRARRRRAAPLRAREIARDRARARASNAHGVGVTASGAAIAGFSQSRWWLRFASVLPLVALVGGLVLIQDWQNRTQISVAAEVDEALLGDDLPINAYRDPGFSEFLKAPPSE